MTLLLAIWNKYKLQLTAFFVGIMFLGIIILGLFKWRNDYAREAVRINNQERDLQIANAPHQIDTVYIKQPKQIIRITSKPTNSVNIDSVFNLAWEMGQDETLRQFEYIAEEVDTTLSFSGGDSVGIQYVPLTHILTVELIRAPLREITVTKMVSIPCEPIPWYDSRTAWYVYGAATVIVLYEAYSTMAR